MDDFEPIYHAIRLKNNKIFKVILEYDVEYKDVYIFYIANEIDQLYIKAWYCKDVQALP
jgi:hypothetical protein